MGTLVELRELLNWSRDTKNLLNLVRLPTERRLQYAANVFSVLSGHRVHKEDIPKKLEKVMSDIAAGNPKYIEEFAVKLLSQDAYIDTNGSPQAAVEINQDNLVIVKASQDDLSKVQPPLKMRSADLATYEKLKIEIQP